MSQLSPQIYPYRVHDEHYSNPLLYLNPDDETLRLHSYSSKSAELSTDGRTIQIFGLSREDKTMALLLRGPGVKPLSAESGWSDWLISHEGCETLKRRDVSTQRVLDRCRSEGFVLPRHERDQDQPGQYIACFAEMQLMTRYIDDLQRDSGHSGWRSIWPLRVVILVSRPPVGCLVNGRQIPDICREYALLLQRKYNVEFILRY